MTVTVPPPANPAPDSSLIVNGGLFWREDEAVKAHLVNAEIVTFDETSPGGGRALPVYFRNPENEQRRRNFPYIVIDRLGWDREVDREMRGPFYLDATDPYCPDGTPVPASGPSRAQQLPIPIMIRYQVQAWARFKRHIIYIENQMLNVLPIRFGAIDMTSSSHARDDDTVRRMDFLGTVPNETTDPDSNADKRLFGRTWTVGISSEILPSDFGAVVTPTVETVIIDPSDHPGYSSVNGQD